MPHDLFKLSLTEGWAFHSCSQHGFHLANICFQVPYLKTLGFYLKFRKSRKRERGRNQASQFWNKKVCGGNSLPYTQVKRKVINIPELSTALTLLFCSPSRLSVERRYFWYRVLDTIIPEVAFQRRYPPQRRHCAHTEQGMPPSAGSKPSSLPHGCLLGIRPQLPKVWSTDLCQMTNCLLLVG